MKPGTTLQNGAVVIESIADPDGYLTVLAVRTDTENLDDYHYATWVVEMNGKTIWGDYFDNLDSARINLRERTAGA